MENVKGFSLFTDVEDKDLQAYNRARIMWNIMEDHVDPQTKRVNPKGGKLALEYFISIPEEERGSAHSALEIIFKEKNIV